VDCMANTLAISIENQIAELARLSKALGLFLDSHDLSPKAAYAVDLTIEELLCNVINHGFEDDLPHTIDVTVEVEPQAVVLRIEDEGREFNPLEAPEPDVKQPIEEREIGGLGIHLVRDMAYSLRYDRKGERNRLEVRIGTD